jgi:hypothetical protein
VGILTRTACSKKPVTLVITKKSHPAPWFSGFTHTSKRRVVKQLPFFHGRCEYMRKRAEVAISRTWGMRFKQGVTVLDDNCWRHVCKAKVADTVFPPFQVMTLIHCC